MVIGFNGRHIGRTFAIPAPIDMWEEAAGCGGCGFGEGARVLRQNERTGFLGPGLYSPLEPLLLGMAFRWMPPNLKFFRIVNLFAGVIFLVLPLHEGPVCLSDADHGPLSLALLLAVDRQLTGLWELPRLDAVLLLFALLYLLLGYSAVQRQSNLRWLLATVVFAIGLLWKQTMLGIAFVPLVASFIVSRPTATGFPLAPFRRSRVGARGRGACGARFPSNMYAAVTVGGKYPIQLRVLARFALAVALSTPLIWLTVTWLLAAAEACPSGGRNLRGPLRLAWVHYL